MTDALGSIEAQAAGRTPASVDDEKSAPRGTITVVGECHGTTVAAAFDGGRVVTIPVKATLQSTLPCAVTCTVTAVPTTGSEASPTAAVGFCGRTSAKITLSPAAPSVTVSFSAVVVSPGIVDVARLRVTNVAAVPPAPDAWRRLRVNVTGTEGPWSVTVRAAHTRAPAPASPTRKGFAGGATRQTNLIRPDESVAAGGSPAGSPVDAFADQAASPGPAPTSSPVATTGSEPRTPLSHIRGLGQAHELARMRASSVVNRAVPPTVIPANVPLAAVPFPPTEDATPEGAPGSMEAEDPLAAAVSTNIDGAGEEEDSDDAAGATAAAAATHADAAAARAPTPPAADVAAEGDLGDLGAEVRGDTDDDDDDDSTGGSPVDPLATTQGNAEDGTAALIPHASSGVMRPVGTKLDPSSSSGSSTPEASPAASPTVPPESPPFQKLSSPVDEPVDAFASAAVAPTSPSLTTVHPPPPASEPVDAFAVADSPPTASVVMPAEVERRSPTSPAVKSPVAPTSPAANAFEASDTDDSDGESEVALARRRRELAEHKQRVAAAKAVAHARAVASSSGSDSDTSPDRDGAA